MDAGTGKVAQIRKSVYDILTTLLESDDVTELLQLSMDSNELIQGIEEIQEAIKTEHILSAKKAIDFLKLHSDKAEETHIGFYGGEPLMNFLLIKQATEYALNVFDGSK